MRKTRRKSVQPSSLSDAGGLHINCAAEQREPVEALADMTAGESKPLYRWIGQPVDRLRQVQNICGISIARAVVQRGFLEAKRSLNGFDQFGERAETTEGAPTRSLTQLRYRRSNIVKCRMPALYLFTAA